MYKITLCAVHFKSPNQPCIAAIDMDGGVYIFTREMSDKICREFFWDGNAPIEIELDTASPLMTLFLDEAKTAFNVQDETKAELLADISFPSLTPEFKAECDAEGHSYSYKHLYSNVTSELANLIRV
jgi:hypothetical protein